ncbi:hypothetical protein [Bacillus sp. 1P06AnD]|uniref:hypothetical protein n=1 Tax=Bacillus sp. 1P06AnD TaxID=3132208 RepID=UPI00399F1507
MSIDLDFSLVNHYYHISPKGAGQPLAEMPATDFFNPETLIQMMHKAGHTVEALGLDLPASFFGTSLCNLCSTKLLFLAQSNVLIDLSLKNLLFQVEVHDDHAHLGYKIETLSYSEVPEVDSLSVIQKDWERFISSEITPAVEAIASAASLKPSMIWLQFGGEMGMLRDFIQQNEKNEWVLAAFKQQFELLSELLSPALFNRKRNPFQHTNKYVDNPYQEGEQLVMRSSCCLYDQRKGGVKCFVCPRLKETEREEMKRHIQTVH